MCMQKARFPAGDGGAADLLGAIGVWGPHDSIRLRQLGLTRDFAPELEVGRLPFGLQHCAEEFYSAPPLCRPKSVYVLAGNSRL